MYVCTSHKRCIRIHLIRSIFFCMLKRFCFVHILLILIPSYYNHSFTIYSYCHSFHVLLWNEGTKKPSVILECLNSLIKYSMLELRESIGAVMLCGRIICWLFFYVIHTVSSCLSVRMCIPFEIYHFFGRHHTHKSIVTCFEYIVKIIFWTLSTRFFSPPRLSFHLPFANKTCKHLFAVFFAPHW